ncbi:UNVERIFIED_CONTAM: Pre-splicing factor CWC22 [Sesamum angustifolium]|uniref:Pre-splicing factor CWC22 n=1 Tax=Sesamum angustifolium TaxID=2727405 RepID=A0AAW2QRF8_9LAMI
MIHRLETNKLRNVAKFFAHLLGTDALPWHVLAYIRLTEEDTTSSSVFSSKFSSRNCRSTLEFACLMNVLAILACKTLLSLFFPGITPKTLGSPSTSSLRLGLGGSLKTYVSISRICLGSSCNSKRLSLGQILNLVVRVLIRKALDLSLDHQVQNLAIVKARRIAKIDAKRREEETKDPPSATTLHPCSMFRNIVFKHKTKGFLYSDLVPDNRLRQGGLVMFGYRNLLLSVRLKVANLALRLPNPVEKVERSGV